MGVKKWMEKKWLESRKRTKEQEEESTKCRNRYTFPVSKVKTEWPKDMSERDR